MSNFNEPLPDISASAIFKAVEDAQYIRELESQQQIDAINAAFDQMLRKQGIERQSTRAAELLRSLQGHSYHRAASLDRIDSSAIDQKSRSVRLTFASEYPYFRRDLNALEVLEMSKSAANLGRLNAGGALLNEHKRDDQIGVVLKAWIGTDKRAHAVVKFSSSKRGQEFFQDVIDGIRQNISFHYRIFNGKVRASSERGKPDTFIATSWEATEISLVSVPADPTVGVGRSERLRSESN